MQLKIQNGCVELSGEVILKHINFEINDKSKIAVIGRNGCGKTTLLKLISGEYNLSKTDEQSIFTLSGKAKIGVLSQITFDNDNLTLLEEIRSAYSEILELKDKLDSAQKLMEHNQTDENIKEYTNLLDTFSNLGGFYFEKEYEAAIKHFGFSEDKNRPLSEFSGGQRTKIAFLKLLLSKPDILLLDEPTNHLDIQATNWLEEYLKNYKKAFVVVSHDRMFLDNVAETIYEIEYGKTYKYNGNYTYFTEQKKLLREKQAKDYESQKNEIERLNQLVDKFRYKATKASMAQSKLKQIEKMTLVEAPENYDLRTFHINFQPDDLGVKDMLSIKDLSIGYENELYKINLEVKKGDVIGIIGGNGLGKSTFVRTITGNIPALSGRFQFATRAKIGYFDQQLAQISSNDTVLDNYMKEYPMLTNLEARSDLGAFLFSGEDVFKTINMLSGGERVRLALCKIFKAKPNFLILDEPTNHMDIVGKETLEDILLRYEGTIIFVSHDRYFIKKLAKSILCFEKDEVKLYPYGYDRYLNLNKSIEEKVSEKPKREKKNYTTPGKERSRLERELRKTEEKISLLEQELKQISAQLEMKDNISDYVKLSELMQNQTKIENELEFSMKKWEELTEKLY